MSSKALEGNLTGLDCSIFSDETMTKLYFDLGTSRQSLQVDAPCFGFDANLRSGIGVRVSLENGRFLKIAVTFAGFHRLIEGLECL